MEDNKFLKFLDVTWKVLSVISLASMLIIIPGCIIIAPLLYSFVSEQSIDIYIGIFAISFFGFGILMIFIIFILAKTAAYASEPHKDKLRYNNFDEILEVADKYFSKKGYKRLPWYMTNYQIPVTLYCRSKGGDYDRTIIIFETEELTESIYKEFNRNLDSIIKTYYNYGKLKKRTDALTIIVSSKKVTDFIRFTLSEVVGSFREADTRLFSVLSFNERAIYIRKGVGGSRASIEGYKELLCDYCKLMKIEKPDFWEKKEKQFVVSQWKYRKKRKEEK